MKRITLFIITMSFINVSVVFAQKNYSKLDEKDNVVLSYKWKPSKICKKDSPLILLIKIENKNDSAVIVNFTVDYFYDGSRKASSEEQVYCIKANKTIKGKLKGLGFDSSVFSNEQLLSDRFDMELNDVKVEQTTSCKNK